VRLNRSQQEQVRTNLGLARTLACRAARAHQGVAGEDLFGAASLGLCRAAADFDPARGVPFSAYATLRIKGELAEVVRRRFPFGFRLEKLREFAPAFTPLERGNSVQAPGPAPGDDLEWDDLMDWWFAHLTADQARVIRGVFWEGRAIRSSQHWAGIPYWYARALQTQSLDLLRSQLQTEPW
jgi:sigma-70-like protein